MSADTPEGGLSASQRRRLRRKRGLQRKARTPVVPIAASTPEPPQPGRLVGEDEEKALRREEDAAIHRQHDWKDGKNPPATPPFSRISAPADYQLTSQDPDADTAPPSHGKRRAMAVTLDVPVKFVPVLEWYASTQGKSPEEAAMMLLGSMLSKLRPDWRKATTGTAGGSVRDLKDVMG